MVFDVLAIASTRKVLLFMNGDISN